jgi:VIT1/CCC1 family predicted Fe2+/Mn2+ transporter
LIADGVSMSVGNYLSTKAEIARYTKEHGHTPPDMMAPLLTATATLVSFIFVGFIPLLIYVLQAAGTVDLSNRSLFWGASMLTGVGFLLIGIVKSRVTETSLIKSLFETLSLGVIAALLAYYVGFFLEKLITGN